MKSILVNRKESTEYVAVIGIFRIRHQIPSQKPHDCLWRNEFLIHDVLINGFWEGSVGFHFIVNEVPQKNMLKIKIFKPVAHRPFSAWLDSSNEHDLRLHHGLNILLSHCHLNVSMYLLDRFLRIHFDDFIFLLKTVDYWLGFIDKCLESLFNRLRIIISPAWCLSPFQKACFHDFERTLEIKKELHISWLANQLVPYIQILLVPRKAIKKIFSSISIFTKLISNKFDQHFRRN